MHITRSKLHNHQFWLSKFGCQKIEYKKMPLSPEISLKISEFISDIYYSTDNPKKWEDVFNNLSELIDCQDFKLTYANKINDSLYTIVFSGQQIDIKKQLSYNWITKCLSDIFSADSLAQDDATFNTTIKNHIYDYQYVNGELTCNILLPKTINYASQQDIVRILIPHLCRAFHHDEKHLISQRWQIFYKDHSKHYGIPIIIINSQMEVIDFNTEFELFIQNNEPFKIYRKKLTLIDNNNEFKKYVASCFDCHEKPPSKKQPFLLDNVSLPIQYQISSEIIDYAFFNGIYSDQQPCLRISIVPLLSARNYFGEIKQYFDLTHTQTELVCLLCEGKTTNEIIELRQKSQHTIRTQIKTILKKTGFSRQPELITNILNMCLLDAFQENKE